eukprot:TRINITY_DN2045_c0_g1_i1.p1 TRINITY_DN2045_c0_g1~~TRINITY_DN2045_c0_g1_i1.p1  ORF type:complete len:205 (+),score=63.53 TRINITY_DN2045_c0_g1_i1:78-692(+)
MSEFTENEELNEKSETRKKTVLECSICFDSAHEPVVTLCGHIYCWSCLFRWLEVSESCPVCKSGVTKDKVVPIYGKDSANNKNKEEKDKTEEENKIPQRPQGRRTESTTSRRQQHFHNGGFGMFGEPGFNGQFGGVSFTAGFGLFPSLFGFQFQTYSNARDHRNENSQEMGDEAPMLASETQIFLSRIIFAIGILLIVCLVLFN